MHSTERIIALPTKDPEGRIQDLSNQSNIHEHPKLQRLLYCDAQAHMKVDGELNELY